MPNHLYPTRLEILLILLILLTKFPHVFVTNHFALLFMFFFVAGVNSLIRSEKFSLTRGDGKAFYCPPLYLVGNVVNLFQFQK
jgi:hypothetical protein